MKPNEPGLQPLSDAEAARRALKLLAERKIVPTPETFADAFWESAGVQPRGTGLAGVLKDVGADLVRQSRMMVDAIEDFLDGRRPKHVVNPEVLSAFAPYDLFQRREMPAATIVLDFA